MNVKVKLTGRNKANLLKFKKQELTDQEIKKVLKFKSIMNSSILNLHLEACLEDSIEKLQVTGQIMPLTYEMKKNAKIVIFII